MSSADDYNELDQRLTFLMRFTSKLTAQKLLIHQPSVWGYESICDTSGTWGRVLTDSGVIEVRQSYKEFLDEYHRCAVMIRAFESE